jgi:hypothetical protein
MAKIKLASPVSDVRGAIGQDVYSNWRGISYIRRKALSISNPNSLFQERVRAAFTDLSKLWLSTLTDAQRAGWEEFAQQLGSASKHESETSRKDIVPALGTTLSGKNAYIALNVQLARSDIARVDDAPLGINAPGQPQGVSVAYTPGPPKKLTLTWTDPTDLEVGGKVSVWGESPGMFHRQIVATVDKAVQTLEVLAMRGAAGASLAIVSGLYRFQIVAWDTHGHRSASSQLVAYNIA